MLVTLEKIEQLNDHTASFWFKADEKLDYIAGQYIEIKLPHQVADSRGEKRWFSLSSSPSEPLLSITTKFSEPGSSFKSVLAQLKPGAEVNMSVPLGDFVLPKDRSRPLVYIVGGVGVTPVRSMLKWLADTGETRQIQTIYAARSVDDLVFADLLDKMSSSFIPIIDDDPSLLANLNKKLNADLLLNLIPNLIESPLVYISGPEPLVESLTKDLGKHLESSQLISDYFPGYKTI